MLLVCVFPSPFRVSFLLMELVELKDNYIFEYVSVSFQSIVSSYQANEVIINFCIKKFPSPFRVSFLLIYEIKLLLEKLEKFPSPFRVSFLLI